MHHAYLSCQGEVVKQLGARNYPWKVRAFLESAADDDNLALTGTT